MHDCHLPVPAGVCVSLCRSVPSGCTNQMLPDVSDVSSERNAIHRPCGEYCGWEASSRNGVIPKPSSCQRHGEDREVAGRVVRALEGQPPPVRRPTRRAVVVGRRDGRALRSQRDLTGSGPVRPHHEDRLEARPSGRRGGQCSLKEDEAGARPVGKPVALAVPGAGLLKLGLTRAVGSDLEEPPVIQIAVVDHHVHDPVAVGRRAGLGARALLGVRDPG